MFTKVPFKARILHDDGIDNAILLDDGVSYLLWGSSDQNIIYSYKPLKDYTETLEWKTDIINSKTKEQRICIRRNPRVIFSFVGYFNDVEYREIKSILRSINTSPMVLPDWNTSTLISTILSSDTEVLFDTSIGLYAEGGLAVFFTETGYYRVGVIDEVQADRIILVEPLGEELSNIKVCPAQKVILRNGMNFNRLGNNINFGNFTLESSESFDYSQALTYPTYRGYPVWLSCNPILGGINDSIVREFDEFDNGQTNIAYEFKNHYLSRTFTLNFNTTTALERSNLKRFFHAMKGRYKTFWIPSYNNDMKLAANITNGSVTMQVEAFGYGYYYDGEVSDILIEMKNGTRYYNRVLSSTKDTDTETFTVQSALASIAIVNVKRIMFLHHVRFDSDAIELRHLTSNITQVSTVVREVRDTVYDL